MDAVSCASCRFFAIHTRHDADIGSEVNLKTGDCRRRAPRDVVGRQGLRLTVWPRVERTLFCGEWQAVDGVAG